MRNMRCAFALIFSSGGLGAMVVQSPDGTIAVSLELKEGVAHWSAKADGVEFMKPGAIEIFQGNTADKPLVFDGGGSFEKTSRDEKWTPSWGQFSEGHDHSNGVKWTLQGSKAPKTVLEVRVSDEGIAVRYQVNDIQGKLGDRTGLNFAGDYLFWGANGERENHGPLQLSAWNAKKNLQAPMTVKVSDALYLGILEAGIYHQHPFSLRRTGGTKFQTRSGQRDWKGEATSSWRVITVGRSAGDLTTNQLIWNLNPKCRLADTSWIKPGFTLWDWRSWGAKAPDGFEYGLNMASWKRFIDFAAKHDRVRYLMLDANWYGPEFDPKSDPKLSRDHILEQLESGKIVRKEAPADWQDPIDVPALIKYGRERGVGIILYINDKARINYDFDETLATYAKWGAAGIKYGFMASKGDEKVKQTRYIVEACARHQLICDFHDGPIPGSGDERTWPNYMAREFCHAQSDAKRSFSPRHFVTTVFNNGLTGSLDMANGLYAIKGAEKVRPRIFTKVETTVVGETARTLISYAALAILPDIPEAYEAKADLFSFIETMPMTWDDTQVLGGEIGEFITVARRSGKGWWIGSATNEEAREVTLDLGFLPVGSTWQATFYEDTAKTHFQTNPEAYRIRTQTVAAGDQLTVKLAPGGGHCLKLTQ